MGVAADDDGFLPARHKARDVVADDGLTEHSASKDVPDGSVGGLPHLLEVELWKGKETRVKEECDGKHVRWFTLFFELLEGATLT